ncbi:unnamed protein product [Mytilus edulis]|uniref:Uncharacterized protein n=1 Tax=Mytilus edulis TaxID=6550 RepID=A0A8S3R4X2_MYTED|nr:unnamed protein product [Mytilus edulis]
MASNQEPEQPKKKKKRIRSKNKDEPIPGAFDLSAILNSQQTFPLSNNMNGQPYMNNNTNFHNMSMPMMSSPFVTSPTQQFQMGAPYMPCPTPTQASPPQWATELLSKFEAMSVKMNSIDEIKSAVSSVDFKLSEMKGDMKKLSKRVLDVETSQNFISKSFDENIKVHEKTNKKIESDIKKLATECEALRNDMSFIKRDSKNLSDSKVNLQKIFKANEKLNNDLESIKCESMRDNLLFHGIKESEGEDCALIIKSMCENNLEIEDELNIKSAFRLGKKNEVALSSQNEGQERIRPILVKFSDRQKRDSVRKRSYKLKSSSISITDQYPKSVVEKRKSLIPYLKKARDADVKAVLIKDKLFIGGVLYSGGPLDVAIANAKKEKIKFSDSENVLHKSQNHDGADVMNENGMQVS